MWPWTHLAFGYLSHSSATHLSLGRRPTDGPVLTALGASILPDLIDKPLAWTFGVTTSGYGPAHSIFIAVPIVVVLALLLLLGLRRAEFALALFTGYISHLVGDLIFQFFDEGRFVAAVILWPLGPPASETNAGALERVVYYLLVFAHGIMDGEYAGYAVLMLSILLGVTILWVYDGKPGINWLFGTRSQSNK